MHGLNEVKVAKISEYSLLSIALYVLLEEKKIPQNYYTYLQTYSSKWCFSSLCLGVPSINLLFVLSYLIKYGHNSIFSDFSIFGIHRVIFLS